MEWVRGTTVGRGSFATVFLAAALIDDRPDIIAVKSASLPLSASLREESEILGRLRGCPEILTCFGDDVTHEDGTQFYNLFLEYLSGGSLADHLRKSGGRLPESDVRRFVGSILRGLRFVHAAGYVHCDIKLQNLLLTSEADVKIADFGLAKVAGERTAELRGTPLYMSPELVARGECEPPTDVWSLGCVVSEMIAGKPAWRCSADDDVTRLLFRIGFGDERPEIPSEMSEEGRDFLSKCFVRDPAKRWTAEMLLEHPFVAGDGKLTEAGSELEFTAKKTFFRSPRSALDFPQWNLDSVSSSLESLNFAERGEFEPCSPSSPGERIRQLAAGQKPPSWSSFSGDNWVTTRRAESSVLRPEQPNSETFESLLEKMETEDFKRDVISNPRELEFPEFASTASTISGSLQSLSSHWENADRGISPLYRQPRTLISDTGSGSVESKSTSSRKLLKQLDSCCSCEADCRNCCINSFAIINKTDVRCVV